MYSTSPSLLYMLRELSPQKDTTYPLYKIPERQNYTPLRTRSDRSAASSLHVCGGGRSRYEAMTGVMIIIINHHQHDWVTGGGGDRAVGANLD